MKKLSCFILSLIIILSTSISAFASTSYEIDLSVDKDIISSNMPTQYGVNLDGIISSNLIENGSFEDGENGWKFDSVEYTYATSEPIHKNNPTYNVINVNKSYLLKNTCYGGASYVKGESYEFSFFARNIDFEGTISVWLDGDKNRNEITQLSTSGISKNSWTKFSAELTSIESEIGAFSINFEGNGSIEIDFVSLVAENSYGYKNESWNGFGISQDTFYALQNIKPEFICFSLSNPSWKNSIGSPYDRENSEFGYHEYLQLCSDLNAIAIPTLNANKYNADSDNFTNYKQDILDLIEYANAKWETSYYGSLRSTNGSPEPFNLKYIRLIGDGEQLSEIKKAVEKKYKYITVLSENDITTIKSESNSLGETLNSEFNTIKTGGFVMLEDFFGNAVKASQNDISYSTTYYAQMLLSNNQGSKIVNASQTATDVEFESEVTVDQSKNSIFISFVNLGSAFNAVLNAEKLEGVTSASIQYISDGYLSSYNDIGKQYVAPIEKDIEIDSDSINVKIPENSVAVIRITYNNANNDVLFSLPETINLKAKNFVPPVFIAIIIALAVAIPIGTVIGFVLYKNVISKKSKEEKNE